MRQASIPRVPGITAVRDLKVFGSVYHQQENFRRIAANVARDGMVPKGVSRDDILAGGSPFIERVLTSFDPVYRESMLGSLKAARLIPIDSADNAGAYNFQWTLTTSTGQVKKVDRSLRANGAIPRADITITESFTNFSAWMGLYDMSQGEVATASMAGVPLLSRRQSAVSRAMAQQLDTVALFGDPDDQTGANAPKGFLNNANVPTAVAPVGVAGHTQWLNPATIIPPTVGSAGVQTFEAWKTADEIVADVKRMVLAIQMNSLEEFTPDTLILPTPHFDYLMQTPFNPPYNTYTIMEWIKRTNPGLTIESMWQALGTWTGNPYASYINSVNVAIAYKKDPLLVNQRVPVLFQSMTPTWTGTTWDTYCYAISGGTTVYFPLSTFKLTSI